MVSFSYFKCIVIFFGIFVLFGMVLGYYGYVIVIKNIVYFIYFIFVWIVCVCIGGIIFGIVGFLWKDIINLFYKFGSLFISGVFVIDGFYIFLNFEDYSYMLFVGYIEVIVGIILIFVLECFNVY